jgi:hypothetical protein
MLQLYHGIGGGELPANSGLLIVSPGGPGLHFTCHLLITRYPPSQTLPAHYPYFQLGHIQP